MGNLIRYTGRLLRFNGELLSFDPRTPFIFKINTELGSGSGSFTLPLTDNTTNLTINTSDNQIIKITSYDDPLKTINFPTPGIYEIKMRGECGWSFDNAGDREKLIGIISWGDLLFNNLIHGFYGCTNLGLGDGLPSIGGINAPNITTLEFTFNGCNLITIPENLFVNCVSAIDFNGVFGYNQITSIPENLFINNPLVINFDGTFAYNQITSIPENLFINNPLVINFDGTFATNLITSIPSGLFDSCINVTTFNSTFFDNKLTSIPSGLFDSCTNVTTFDYTFYNNQITSIPVELFYNCVNVTTFNATFWDNKLTSIPPGLFDSCNLVTTFNATFQQNQLTTIPLGLFNNCVGVTSFDSTFEMNQITIIPENLFYYNINVTSYRRTFREGITTGCQMPAVIFNLSYLGSVTNFENTFYCATTTKSPSGIVQPIWTYATLAFKIDCFQNCTGLTNYYSSIPFNWR